MLPVSFTSKTTGPYVCMSVYVVSSCSLSIMYIIKGQSSRLVQIPFIYDELRLYQSNDAVRGVPDHCKAGYILTLCLIIALSLLAL